MAGRGGCKLVAAVLWGCVAGGERIYSLGLSRARKPLGGCLEEEGRHWRQRGRRVSRKEQTGRRVCFNTYVPSYAGVRVEGTAPAFAGARGSSIGFSHGLFSLACMCAEEALGRREI